MAGKRRTLVIPTVNTGSHALDHDQLPDHVKEDLGRLIFKGVRKFFSDPAVQEDYQKWLVEYRKTHPEKGGETC